MRTRETDVEPFVNLSELTEIELLILRRMREFTIGEHRSLFHGTGFDFVGLRDWQAGDRMSAIDWPQSTLKNFSPMVVRDFEQPSTANVIVVADGSLSTRCGIDGVPIAAAIARAIGTIGMSAVFFQDMFGIITFDTNFSQLAAVRPRIGKNQVIHCLEAYQFQTGLQPLKRADSLSMSLAGFMRKTSMVPVISDFLFDDAAVVMQELGHLNSTHDVFIVLIDSAFAFELPRVSAGWIETFDVETGRAQVLSRHALGALARRTRSWQDEVARMAKNQDLDVLRIGVDEQQTAIALSEFIAERRLRKGVAVMVRASIFLMVLVAAGSIASAQTVETDPLQCWWRTSTSSVRVGEPFTVVLTCAVLETEAATVVVDQSKLEPSVVQFAPFEVLGGSHGADLRTDLRRFFQYQYRLRLIAENEFGKDVALPELKLSYRVQSKVGQNAAIQGRDQSYVLPAQSIRILSLVPSDASDIRDTPAETFADLDQRAFRANLFKVVGGVLFALAGLLLLLAIVRGFSRFRKTTVATERLASDGAILGAAGRELGAVQRDREQGGWTPELAARALTALRVGATYALGRPVAQSAVTGAISTVSNQRLADADGILMMKTGWPRTKRVAISGAVTARSFATETKRGLGDARRAALLDSLEGALAQFTAAQYGRDVKPDDSALDGALATGRAALKRIRLDQTWIMKKFGRRPPPREVEARAWSR